MSSTASSRTFASAARAGAAHGLRLDSPRARCSTATISPNLTHWHIEAEKPGRISAANGVLDIDVPAGVTLWFKPRLEGPVAIEFEATAVSEGGPNDQVSDLNVFWMANNVDGQQPVFAQARSGAFADYNDLLTLLRGPRRQPQHHHALPPLHRRPGPAPAAPEHDLGGARRCCSCPIARQTIRLVADGKIIEYRRDGTRIFHLEDASPYDKRLVRAAHDLQPPAHPPLAHLAGCR